MGTSPAYIMGWEKGEKPFELIEMPKMISIPIYGRIPAGTPLQAIEEIDGEVAIPADWIRASRYEYFALKIKGTSMEPKYMDGDIVIIRVQPDCENGQDCIVFVNGEDATFKKVIKGEDHIILQPYNRDFELKSFYGEQLNEIRILGVVKQLVRNY